MAKFTGTIGVGITWYAAGDYARVREIMADGQDFPVLYDRWQERFEEATRYVIANGGRPIPVKLEPDKFVAWCAIRGHNVDANARFAYTSDPINWPATGKH
jgi:hypothetical protein